MPSTYLFSVFKACCIYINIHRVFRESEGSFQYGNYSREAEDLRAVVEHFKGEQRFIAAVIGHSKGTIVAS